MPQKIPLLEYLIPVVAPYAGQQILLSSWRCPYARMQSSGVLVHSGSGRNNVVSLVSAEN